MLHRSALGALLMLAPTIAPAVAQPSPPIALAELTCAELMSESGPNPQIMVSAMAGMLARRAGQPLLSEARIMAGTAAARAACTAPDAGARRVLDIVTATPATAEAALMDFTGMTCATLLPLWREKARMIVPFLAGWSNASVSRQQMDRLAGNIQGTCRDPNNGHRPVMEIATTP